MQPTLAAIHSESCPTSYPGFCVPPSEVAVLFKSNLSTLPFLRQIVYLDLVFCTGFYNFYSEHAVLFLFHQRPMSDQKIERSNECCFGRQQLLAYSIKNVIWWKKWLVTAQNLQSIKPLLTLKQSQTESVILSTARPREVATFSEVSQQPLLPTRKGSAFVFACQSRPSCARALPQELGHCFCSQNLWLSSGMAFGSDCQMTDRGLNLDSNLNSAALLTSCKGFICSEVPG